MEVELSEEVKKFVKSLRMKNPSIVIKLSKTCCLFPVPVAGVIEERKAQRKIGFERIEKEGISIFVDKKINMDKINVDVSGFWLLKRLKVE
ncbi:MAG: CC/Se motif family (seleno)protein [Candidatus Hydrothermarchaeota archaeon]